jgi:hypothetical protein
LGKNKTHFIPRALKCKNYIIVALKKKDKRKPFELPQEKTSRP